MVFRYKGFIMIISTSENTKRCVVVQGPTYEHSFPQIKKCWEGYDVIYSTWKGYEKHYQNESVIFSDLPSEKGVHNINYQKHSTVNGILRAKEMGYDRVLKIRSDMWVKNPKLFFEKMTKGYNTQMWVEYNGGYLTDYWMEDSIDNLLMVWDIGIKGPFPERILTDKIKDLGFLNRINFLLSYFDGTELDMFWNRKNGGYWQSTLRGQDQYKTNETWE
jgi:hypothetical protein